LALSIIASWFAQPAKLAAPRAAVTPARPTGVFPRARFAATPAAFGIVLVSLAAVLILVKWHSIASGPTSNEAIAVIRVVEAELGQTQRQQGSAAASNVRNAGDRLSTAWFHFDQKQYQRAIRAAQEAGQILRARQ
jgi:hypothetical protein